MFTDLTEKFDGDELPEMFMRNPKLWTLGDDVSFTLRSSRVPDSVSSIAFSITQRATSHCKLNQLSHIDFRIMLSPDCHSSKRITEPGDVDTRLVSPGELLFEYSVNGNAFEDSYGSLLIHLDKTRVLKQIPLSGLHLSDVVKKVAPTRKPKKRLDLSLFDIQPIAVDDKDTDLDELDSLPAFCWKGIFIAEKLEAQSPVGASYEVSSLAFPVDLHPELPFFRAGVEPDLMEVIECFLPKKTPIRGVKLFAKVDVKALERGKAHKSDYIYNREHEHECMLDDSLIRNAKEDEKQTQTPTVNSPTVSPMFAVMTARRLANPVKRKFNTISSVSETSQPNQT